MATNKLNSLYIRLGLLVTTSFLIFCYLQIKEDTALLEHLLNKQASKQAEVLATGSLDNLLSKDYGDMEQWVTAVAAGDEYAYA
jgi:hypothetical protein